MKIWVTGANGLLGNALRSSVDFATTREEVDIGEIDSVSAFVKNYSGITHIVNAAAFSLVDLAEKEREQAFRANGIGPENLGLIANEIGAKVVHISTDYVFSGDLKRFLHEEDKTDPCNYYGVTKLEGEKRLQQVHPEACIIRTSWIFGSGGKNFVAKLFEMLQSAHEIRLAEDQWGRPTYVEDLKKVIFHMLDISGLYHFANAEIASKYTFGVAMREEAEALGFPVQNSRILPVPSASFAAPCRRPVYSPFDTRKIEKLLNRPIRSWRNALREYLCDLSARS